MSGGLKAEYANEILVLCACELLFQTDRRIKKEAGIIRRRLPVSKDRIGSRFDKLRLLVAARAGDGMTIRPRILTLRPLPRVIDTADAAGIV